MIARRRVAARHPQQIAVLHPRALLPLLARRAQQGFGQRRRAAAQPCGAQQEQLARREVGRVLEQFDQRAVGAARQQSFGFVQAGGKGGHGNLTEYEGKQKASL